MAGYGAGFCFFDAVMLLDMVISTEVHRTDYGTGRLSLVEAALWMEWALQSLSPPTCSRRKSPSVPPTVRQDKNGQGP